MKELEKLSTNMVMKHDVSPFDDLLRYGVLNRGDMSSR